MDNKKKNFNFWNFDETIPLSSTKFGEDKLLNQKELDFINNKLKTRMKQFENSFCYNFLEDFYKYYQEVNNSKNEEQMNINYDKSLKSLQTFTFCYEDEYNNTKSNNYY